MKTTSKYAVSTDQAKRWRRAHPEIARQQSRAASWRAKLRKFDMSEAEFVRMYAEQEGRCAICGNHRDDSREFTLDHDHVTGKHRGLICTTCNSGLGMLKDSPDLLRKAADYLDKWARINSLDTGSKV